MSMIRVSQRNFSFIMLLGILIIWIIIHYSNSFNNATPVVDIESSVLMKASDFDEEFISSNPKYLNRHSAFQSELVKKLENAGIKEKSGKTEREPVGIILGKNHAKSWNREHQEKSILLQKEVIKNNVIMDHQLSHKIVHLDLKGAKPKVSYLKILFPYMKDMGATGLLMEYEDAFPYWGDLSSLSAHNAYTPEDIKAILKAAKDSDLEVIPLVQSLGHMESSLKLKEFAELREVPSYPQVICPTHNKSATLVKSMIDQVIELHPGLNWLHIGADEAYNMGECSRCQSIMAAKQWGKSEMYLYHIKKIAKYVKETYDIQPIIWDDELRKTPITTIRKANIKDYVEIMVWKYSSGIMMEMRLNLWEKYMETFSGIWIASAFKGASKPNSFITNINERLANHKEWMEVVDMYKNVIPFRGIVLTGWQRFDHFAVLCELLPQAIPSLAVNLMYITERKADHNALSKVGQALNCNSYINLDLKYLDFVNKCNFPGSDFYEVAQTLHILRKDLDKMYQNPHVTGWVSDYNIKHYFASPQHVEQGLQDLSMMLYEVRKLKSDSEKILSELYDEYTVHEWLEQNVFKILNELEDLHKTCAKLLQINHWPRRPLEIIHRDKEL